MANVMMKLVKFARGKQSNGKVKNDGEKHSRKNNGPISVPDGADQVFGKTKDKDIFG